MGVRAHFNGLALDGALYGVETWPGKLARLGQEYEQTDEQHPEDSSLSQTAPAGPGP